MTTTAARTLGRLAIVVLLGALPLAACSDDDDGESTSTTEAPSETDTSDGTLPETDPRIDAALDALDASIASFEPPLEVKDATVDLVVIGPVDPDDTLDPATAEEACDAALTVAFSELPTAKVTIVDGDGTELVVTGVAGCTPAE